MGADPPATRNFQLKRHTMARGRKKDLTIPPTRALTQQRDYRARRAQYVSDLEDKCRALETENNNLKQEVNALRVQLPAATVYNPAVVSRNPLPSLSPALVLTFNRPGPSFIAADERSIRRHAYAVAVPAPRVCRSKRLSAPDADAAAACIWNTVPCIDSISATKLVVFPTRLRSPTVSERYSMWR